MGENEVSQSECIIIGKTHSNKIRSTILNVKGTCLPKMVYVPHISPALQIVIKQDWTMSRAGQKRVGLTELLLPMHRSRTKNKYVVK